LHAAFGNRQGFSGLVAWWKEASPAPDDLVIGPVVGDVRVDAHEHVVIHDREPADGNGEDLGKLFESSVDPFFAVDGTFGEQEGASDAAGDAVVSAGYGGVDQMRARHCHGWIS
jgi:hypothetical protein